VAARLQTAANCCESQQVSRDQPGPCLCSLAVVVVVVAANRRQGDDARRGWSPRAGGEGPDRARNSLTPTHTLARQPQPRSLPPLLACVVGGRCLQEFVRLEVLSWFAELDSAAARDSRPMNSRRAGERATSVAYRRRQRLLLLDKCIHTQVGTSNTMGRSRRLRPLACHRPPWGGTHSIRHRCGLSFSASKWKTKTATSGGPIGWLGEPSDTLTAASLALVASNICRRRRHRRRRPKTTTRRPRTPAPTQVARRDCSACGGRVVDRGPLSGALDDQTQLYSRSLLGLRVCVATLCTSVYVVILVVLSLS
jgi:hypothetical protein